MDERMRFVIRLKDGESKASLCREFGISRKTGYKIFERYEECGLEGLSDRAHRPFAMPTNCPNRSRPRSWRPGARNQPGALARSGNVCCSSIHAVLDRHGLVTRPTRSRTRAEGTPLSEGTNPNDLWCTDYKGEFMLGDERYCYPLTVTDHASRYLLLCEAMESNREKLAFTAFERLFKERGLPSAIRSDNSVPFASPNGLFNLSKLSVWWLRLGMPSSAFGPVIRSRTVATNACT
jgi:transposase InsO family protein